MKILNLYAGIGGNRKLWGDKHEITAIEYNSKVAEIYQDFFPNDNVIVGDAHEYLLNNYMHFDFIWASPPCPSHSDIRRCGVHSGQCKAIYPEMSLYQEIILLQKFYKGLWCIENVIPYYKPLIEPNYVLHRHNFWCNFIVQNFNKKTEVRISNISSQEVFGFDLTGYTGIDKRKALRNLVFPELGKHVLDNANRTHEAFKVNKENKELLVQKELF